MISQAAGTVIKDNQTYKEMKTPCMYIDVANEKLNMLKGLKFKVSRDTVCKLYKSLIRPVMKIRTRIFRRLYGQ